MRDPMRDPYVDRAISLTYSPTHPAAAAHLIWHSDAQGYYLPVDFSEVIFPADEFKIPGEMIGSAVALREECARLAKILELPDGLDPEDREVWECASQQGYPSATRWREYGIETFTCLRLLRACEIALDSGCAIVFHSARALQLRRTSVCASSPSAGYPVTGRCLRPRKPMVSRRCGSSTVRWISGRRRSNSGIATCASRRASGAPMQ